MIPATSVLSDYGVTINHGLPEVLHAGRICGANIRAKVEGGVKAFTAAAGFGQLLHGFEAFLETANIGRRKNDVHPPLVKVVHAVKL
ncbi:hypothetical protein L596_021627 [Steinernema carpocapsae]|uniref:Uncharacterized protein n=1 Tax=Steinernema carpocapsae TaxID=34508 RepID=A0A4U5MJA3_STECR|nr:hypothetical protein L596_021627 [Steinernema carpocapsae]